MIIEFIDHFVSRYLGNLCAYLNADAIEDAIGVNFMYVLLAFWIVWVVCSIFLFRPLPIGIANTLGDTSRAIYNAAGNAMDRKDKKDREAYNREQNLRREAGYARSKEYNEQLAASRRSSGVSSPPSSYSRGSIR